MNLDKALALMAERGPDECWIWPGHIDAKGYGRVLRDGKQRLAHREAYTQLVGPIPADKELDHLCRNPACFNSRHLEAVSHKVNCLRGASVPADNAAKTHCKHGHPFDDANTRYLKRKHRSGRTTIMRVCRACVLIDTWIRRGKLSPNHRDLPLSQLRKAYSRLAS